ncbi:hypothetical protein [Nitrosospira sp. Is2]|uniref:hypothetical protein n=1 Tax=Nitrosospira sp. Is2 TaxID=3080532 RepID=UPI002955C487|nr:hypothetical protein [Nitrosospira sp. Is2]WON74455.1 hypothetical protein R5L00_02895 [Nitrosospira sp. Is2]
MTSVSEFATKIGLGPRPISLTDLVRKFGTKSLREAIAAQEAAEREIEQYYVANLGILTVGSPTGPVTLTPQGDFRKPYSFGSIIRPAGEGNFPDVGERFHVTIRLQGIRCFGTDDPGGTDEPFLISSVTTLDPRDKTKSAVTTKINHDAIGDVHVGTVFGKNIDLAVDIAVPGDSDIALSLLLFDEETFSKPEDAAKKISALNTAHMQAGIATLTAFVPAAGVAVLAAEAILHAAGDYINEFSDAIGKTVADWFSDDHIGTVSLTIDNQFLRTLRDNPESLDRKSDSIGGATYNFPQLPEDDSEAGKSWMFREEGKGTYRPFFKVVRTEP